MSTTTKHNAIFLMALAALPMGVLAQKSDGLRFGNFKISPYVSIDASYDSNIRLVDDAQADLVYRVNPGLDAQYTGTDWGIVGNAWYAYDLYQKYDMLNAHRYGENLEIYVESLKGWKFRMGERYDFSNQNDSMLSGGSGVWRNRHQFDVDALLAYEISERWAVGLNAVYSDNWFDSKTVNEYGPLFGWSSAQIGAEMEYALTPKTGLILNGAFQRFISDGNVPGESNESDGYSFAGGFGSRFTERLKYRILVGANIYSTDSETTISPSVNATINWKMSERWALTMATATYFQPSESTPGQARNIWSLSGGVSYKPAERVDMTADIVYRRENNETMSNLNNQDFVTDQYAARYRVAYWFIKYASVYAAAEYTFQASEQIDGDWDRYRLTLGCLFRY